MAAQGDGAGAFAHSPGHMLWQPNILNVTGIFFQIRKFVWWDWRINWLTDVKRGLKSYHVIPGFSGKQVNMFLLLWNTWSFLGFLFILLYSPPTAPVSVREGGEKANNKSVLIEDDKKRMCTSSFKTLLLELIHWNQLWGCLFISSFPGLPKNFHTKALLLLSTLPTFLKSQHIKQKIISPSRRD